MGKLIKTGLMGLGLSLAASGCGLVSYEAHPATKAEIDQAYGDLNDARKNLIDFEGAIGYDCATALTPYA